MRDPVEVTVALDETSARELRRSWGWILAVGVALILLGFLLLNAYEIATLAWVYIYGWVLVIAGAAQLTYTFLARRWTGVFLHLLTGILDIVVGVLFVLKPDAGAEVLTLLLAAYFMVGGLFRIAASVLVWRRFPNAVWLLLTGAVALLLGLLIWQDWRESSKWVIGVFIGIKMLLNGWSLVMLSLTARNLPPPEAT
jgi:uncharacterized membrane protein HdeD (DUF308 family)